MEPRWLDVVDGGAAVLCLVGFVASLVRRLGGEPVSIWLLVSLPLIALLSVGRIAHRRKRAGGDVARRG